MKKQGTRVLSIALAIAMLLSILPMAAFAATPVGDLIAQYKETHGGLAVGKAADAPQQVADYEAIAAAYNALPDDAAKDALGVSTIAEFFTMVYNYHRSNINTTAANINTYIATNYATANMLTSQQWAKYITGADQYPGAPAKFTTSLDYAAAANKAAYETFMNDFDALNDYVKDYLFLFNGSRQFTSAPQNSIWTTFVRVNLAYRTKNTEGGSTEKAMAAMVEDFSTKYMSSNLKAGFSVVNKTYNALLTFADSGDALDMSGFAGVQAEYEALSTIGLYAMNAMSSYTTYRMVVNSVNASPSYLLAFAANADTVMQVTSSMVSYDFDNPSNATIEAMFNMYNPLSTVGKNIINTAEFKAKYDAIYATYQPSGRPARDTAIPAKESYTKSVVKYPYAGCKFTLQASGIVVNPLVAMVVELAFGDVNKLFTNSTVSTIASINGALQGVLDGVIADQGGLIGGVIRTLLNSYGAYPSTAMLADHLTEEQFADAKAYLSTLADWSEFDANAIDWGVIDGDRETFMAAIVAALRPVTALLWNMGYMPDTLDALGNFVSDGVYETAIIPLLEALGCDGIVLADDMMAHARELAKDSSGKFSKNSDALGYALANPIINLLGEIIYDPLPTILDLIPNLAHAEITGELDGLYNLQIGLGTIYSVNVSEMLGLSSLQGLLDMVVGLVFPASGEEGAPQFELPDIDWEYVAYLGTLKHRPGAKGDSVYINYIEADRVDVLKALLNYLGKTLAYGDNGQIVTDMLTSALGLNIRYADIKSLSTALQSKDPVKAVNALIDFLKKLLSRAEALEGCCECDECICLPNEACDEACTCEHCNQEPTPDPDPDPDPTPSDPVDVGGIFKSIGRFFTSMFRTAIDFIVKLFTGRVPA